MHQHAPPRRRSHHPSFVLAGRLAWLVGAVALVLVPVAFAGKGGGGGSCNRAKTCDTTPPTISIAAPTGGSTVSGTVTAFGAGTDNVGVASVRVQVDAGTPQSATGTTSWSDAVDTTTLADGSHVITAAATDAAGNVGTATITVTVSNQPTPSPPPPPSPKSCPTGSVVPTPTLAQGTIGGYIFQDCNRDGTYTTDEQPLGSQQLYVFDGAGAYVGTTLSDASGWYQFTGLSDGQYTVQFASASWYPLRSDWVPDTTGSGVPKIAVSLAGTARSDFGWRKIIRSTDLSTPISSFVGPNGLTVQSYDDVVAAKTIYDHLMTGSLVGSEAKYETIRFDFGTSGNMTSTGVAQTSGVYTSFSAVSYLEYVFWLDNGDDALFHEYGHVWSKYYAYIVQQDPKLTSYLQARGLLGDSRLGTSYAWDPDEIIAEDYRQLFGDASAQAASQMNRDIPPASQVVGLKDFLATAFTHPPA